MDCSICSSMPYINLRPPRNTICGACYDGAKSIITLMNKLQTDDHDDHNTASVKTVANDALASSSDHSRKPPQPLADLPKWMMGMKDLEAEMNEKISFLGGFVDLFKDQILTDIQLKPGNDGPSISAHRAILAARSEIFKNMLESDAYKAPAGDTIILPELNHEELESLLEFLYCGSLSIEKLEKHIFSLTLAADKYEISYLLKFCEKHMLRTLNSTNALDVLEISDVCSSKILKETALNFIVKNMEDVVFSPKYEAFVPKNPYLAVHVTRAVLMDAKNRRSNGV